MFTMLAISSTRCILGVLGVLIVVATVYDIILSLMSSVSIDVDDENVNSTDVTDGSMATITISNLTRDGVSTETFPPVDDDAPLLGRHTSLLQSAIITPSASKFLFCVCFATILSLTK